MNEYSRRNDYAPKGGCVMDLWYTLLYFVALISIKFSKF